MVPINVPNIILFFADDLGYGDLSCFGHPTIHTPTIDRMATNGIKFTQWYSAASVCTPSRAALMTGRLPVRSGMSAADGIIFDYMDKVLWPDSVEGLPQEELTIAEVLNASGYITGLVGKWHLGVGANGRHLPTTQGFSYYYGIPYSNDMDGNHFGYTFSHIPLFENEVIIEQPVDFHTLPEKYMKAAVSFIRQAVDSKTPFFLYQAFHQPHYPNIASHDLNGRTQRGAYGDNVKELDHMIHHVLSVLADLAILQNTLIIFTSDNGGWHSIGLEGGSNGLLRGGKGGTFEGGIRVPTIAYWPGVISPGQISTYVASHMDLFPTFVSLASAQQEIEGHLLDGKDLTPLLTRYEQLYCSIDDIPCNQHPGHPDSKWNRFSDSYYIPGKKIVEEPRTLLHYRGQTLFAVRHGPYKIHFYTNEGWGKNNPTKSHEPPLLFNVEEDPGENHPISETALGYEKIMANIMRALESRKTNIEVAKPIIFSDRLKEVEPCCDQDTDCRCNSEYVYEGVQLGQKNKMENDETIHTEL